MIVGIEFIYVVGELPGFPPFVGETPQEVFANILDYESILSFPEDDSESPISRECEDFIRW